MNSRDPERIDRMVELLREAWRLFPDWRLTQLVINTTDMHHDCSPVFYLEDDEMERRLQRVIDDRRKFLKEQERK